MQGARVRRESSAPGVTWMRAPAGAIAVAAWIARALTWARVWALSPGDPACAKALPGPATSKASAARAGRNAHAAWAGRTPNAAWAAQYGGQFEAVDGFIQRSRALRLAERVEAELDRLWRSRGRLAVIAVVGLMFVVGQIWLNQQMSSLLAGDQLAGRLARLGETTGVWRWLIEVLAHVLSCSLL